MSENLDDIRLNAERIAKRCAKGEHIFVWTGRVALLEDGLNYQELKCAFTALHDENTVSPTKLGLPYDKM